MTRALHKTLQFIAFNLHFLPILVLFGSAPSLAEVPDPGQSKVIDEGQEFGSVWGNGTIAFTQDSANRVHVFSFEGDKLAEFPLAARILDASFNYDKYNVAVILENVGIGLIRVPYLTTGDVSNMEVLPVAGGITSLAFLQGGFLAYTEDSGMGARIKVLDTFCPNDPREYGCGDFGRRAQPILEFGQNGATSGPSFDGAVLRGATGFDELYVYDKADDGSLYRFDIATDYTTNQHIAIMRAYTGKVGSQLIDFDLGNYYRTVALATEDRARGQIRLFDHNHFGVYATVPGGAAPAGIATYDSAYYLKNPLYVGLSADTAANTFVRFDMRNGFYKPPLPEAKGFWPSTVYPLTFSNPDTLPDAENEVIAPGGLALSSNGRVALVITTGSSQGAIMHVAVTNLDQNTFENCSGEDVPPSAAAELQAAREEVRTCRLNHTNDASEQLAKLGAALNTCSAALQQCGAGNGAGGQAAISECQTKLQECMDGGSSSDARYAECQAALDRSLTKTSILQRGTRRLCSSLSKRGMYRSNCRKLRKQL